MNGKDQYIEISMEQIPKDLMMKIKDAPSFIVIPEKVSVILSLEDAHAYDVTKQVNYTPPNA